MKNFVQLLIFLGFGAVVSLTFVACIGKDSRVPASDNYSPEVIKLIKSENH